MNNWRISRHSVASGVDGSWQDIDSPSWPVDDSSLAARCAYQYANSRSLGVTLVMTCNRNSFLVTMRAVQQLKKTGMTAEKAKVSDGAVRDTIWAADPCNSVTSQAVLIHAA